MTVKVLWDDTHLFTLTLADEHALDKQAFVTLTSAKTFAEVRNAQLPSWAEMVLESAEEALAEETDMGEGSDVPGAAPWCIPEEAVDLVTVPWDVEHLRAWLPAVIIEEHFVVEGASPGGNIDGYEPKSLEDLLLALVAAGFEPERNDQVYEDWLAFLDSAVK
jgi:hypothetical protein